MNTSKNFKIGDKVKFICGYEETSLSFPCCYSPFGKIGTIVNFHDGDTHLVVEEESGDRWTINIDDVESNDNEPLDWQEFEEDILDWTYNKSAFSDKLK